MDQAPVNRPDLFGDAYCLHEDPDFEFRVGLVGTGSGFKTVVDLCQGGHYEDYIPRMRLVACAEPGPNQAKVDKLHRLSIPLYPDWRDMLAAHPEINVLVELSGGRFRIPRIRAEAPAHVSILDHSLAVLFCGFYNMMQVYGSCRADVDRRQALIEAIVDGLKEDVLLLDKELRIMDLNRTALERTGMAKETVLGRGCSEIDALAPGEPFCRVKDVNCPVHETLRTSKKAEAMLTRIGPDGRLNYFRLYSYPIFNASGGLDGVMILRRDITARTRLEKERGERERLSVLGEMSMYLAHELRNPLCAVGGFTKSLLAAPELSDKSRDKLKIIEEETKRLDSMLTRILNFAKPSSPDVEEFDAAPVAADVVELMAMGFSGSGHRIELHAGDNVPHIRWNPDLLKQCLINLVKNAVEASPGGGAIEVVLAFEDGWVRLSVVDKGKGMTAEELDRIFSPFHSSKPQGYGLGLAMIKKNLDDVGGRIDVRSRPGEGTTASLLLPPAAQDGAERRIVAI